ncbi:MAG: M3 family metallopeptidase [Bacteroidales bacterium]|nr:M3 family metallopeptidase [Bacteroidales bacterium]
MATAVAASAANPFFEAYRTPHGTMPFDKIKNKHYKEAFLEGMKRQKAEIQKIVDCKEEPNFENTIVALEHSGRLLCDVESVFFNLESADSDDEMQNISLEVSPLLSEHSNDISLNEELFARVKTVYDNRNELGLNTEQMMLLQKTYDGFVRSGASLSDADKVIFREISKELSELTLRFGQNVLKETAAFRLNITDRSQLAGLPEDVIASAEQTAKEKGEEGWTFTLYAPSYVPFMKYADNRELRRQLYMAYNTKCTHADELDNLNNVKRISELRLKVAKLLGYRNYAEYVLKKRMAENEQNVYKLLNQLLDAYKPTALNEYAEVQSYAKSHGADFEIMPWDWSYYSEKLKHEKYNISDEVLKPYFELNKVKGAVFGLAQKLYGMTFVPNKKIPVYHNDVEAFDVFDSKGGFLAVLYVDFYARESKRGGAWMTEFKGQWKDGGEDSRPHISLVMNFTPPRGNEPVLLTFDELTTFLHEFGHAIHGMLSDVTYESLSGTNVYRDFVELPSQIMENWASEKEFLDGFAVHYKTGEKLPMEYVDKIKAAENFNVAYACLRQLSFGFLDMAWHTLTTPYSGDVMLFEREAWKQTQILPQVEGTCMSVNFNHIFSGGYAAGYYGYKWAEVLDADAFSVFKANGIFDRKTADSFRINILQRGGTEHPMILYKRFRGQDPSIEGLLRRNGIIK